MLRRTPIKRGRKPSATAQEKAWMDHVASLGCLVCGSPAEIHHVSASIHGGRVSRSNKRVAPLCPVHHRKGCDPLAGDPVSVEGCSHRGFYERHGIDLLAWADEEWAAHHPEEVA